VETTKTTWESYENQAQDCLENILETKTFENKQGLKDSIYIEDLNTIFDTDNCPNDCIRLRFADKDDIISTRTYEIQFFECVEIYAYHQVS
jgi:virulence-associated protein VapD